VNTADRPIYLDSPRRRRHRRRSRPRHPFPLRLVVFAVIAALAVSALLLAIG
jgi:hypothetical protein